MLALLTSSPLDHLNEIQEEIRAFILQKNYPCLAAQRSLRNKESIVGLYEEFGTGKSSSGLRLSLLEFLQQQKLSASPYLSYWAVFGLKQQTETEFEDSLWRELSHLTSEEEKLSDWPKGKCLDPEDTNFRFSLGGSELFVVGLHPNSSRRARRFPRPALVFNSFTQFEILQRQGIYENMVKAIRNRELLFDGSVNPMVELHGETWETIQASGKKNSSKWKCPFRFLHKGAK